MSDVYQHSLEVAGGEALKLSDYEGKVLLIVNTASKCGFTPQYKGLEALHQEYKDKGLVIVGCPCNQFAGQEPGSDQQINEFCELNFGVTFPLVAKLDVNGDQAHPLFKDLKQAAPGILGTEKIKWNFTKFLVSKDGKTVKRFAPKDKPESMRKAIEALL